MDASERQNGNQETSRELVTTSRRHEIPEFTDLVFSCRHQPLRVLVIGITLSAALVWLAWILTSPLYRAEGLVRVRQEQDVIFAAQTSRSADNAFFHSQEQLALSPQVLGAALDQADVRSLGELVPTEEPIEWIRGQLRVDMQGGSEVMTIAAVNESPRVAYALANAVTQSYLGEITNRLNADRERREQELEQAAKVADSQLDEHWSQLNSVAQSVGTDNSQSLTIRDELQLQAYRDYSRQLQTAQLRGNELETQLLEAKRRFEVGDPSSGSVTEAMVFNDPEVMSAKQRVQTLRGQFDEMRQVAADLESPRLKRLQQDLRFYESDLEKVILERTAALREQMQNESASARENSLLELQQQIDRNRAEKDFLRQRLSEIDTGVIHGDEETGVDLEMWRHTIQRQTRLADQLWQSLQELRIEQQAQPRVTLIELASVPTRADHSRQLKAAGAAGMLGWALAILGVGFVEWSECRIRFAEDVTSRFVFPVFGKDHSAQASLLKRGRDDGGAREAAAQMMLLNQKGSSIPTIMVASASSHDPRHLAATELARSLSMFRRRTLLIDADAKGNRLSRAIGVERLPGLRQIADASEARHLIIPSDNELLDYLSIGPKSDEDAWIDPQILASVLESLREDYQAIVVNGPALMSSAESLLLASQVDVLLLTAQLGASRWDEMGISADSAAQASIRIGGCVLQHNRRGKKLRLNTERQGQPRSVASEHPAESALREQIDEIKQVLEDAQQSQSPSTSSSTTQSADPTSSADRRQ
ncbi:MAG: hypothetical protein AAGG48_14805 [Planctomycetota bacterium]